MTTTVPRPRVLLINPNTTEAMTAAMAAQLSRHLGDQVAVQPVTATFGHPVIASRVSYAIAAHAALDAYSRAGGEQFDAIILGCFGDPGLEALREIAPVPVIGLAEASFDAAAAFGDPFSVLTIGPLWRDILTERLTLHPASRLCRGIEALQGTGLDFAGHPEHLIAELDQTASTMATAGALTIVLGGSVLAGLAPRLKTPARFVDCLVAAASQVMTQLSLN